jgi:hypothetical protein
VKKIGCPKHKDDFTLGSFFILLFPPVNVQLGGGGDEVVVLARLELQGVRHRGERPEGDREESDWIEK